MTFFGLNVTFLSSYWNLISLKKKILRTAFLFKSLIKSMSTWSVEISSLFKTHTQTIQKCKTAIKSLILEGLATFTSHEGLARSI